MSGGVSATFSMGGSVAGWGELKAMGIVLVLIQLQTVYSRNSHGKLRAYVYLNWLRRFLYIEGIRCLILLHLTKKSES